MRAETIDVTRVTDNASLSAFHYGLLFLCGLAYIVDGLDAQNIALAAPSIASEWATKSSAFGIVFAATYLGWLLGGIGSGPIADRWGRKPVLLLALLLMGGATVSTAFVRSSEELIVLRLLTGIGIGSVLPALSAISAEYIPARVRTLALTCIHAQFPVGTMLGSILGAWIIPTFGWHSIFLIEGSLPILLSVIFLILLPESIRYLVTRSYDAGKIARLLNRLLGTDRFSSNQIFVSSETEVAKASVIQLFANGRAAFTVLMWVTLFGNVFVINFMTSWLPTILHRAQFGLSHAIGFQTILHLGGIIGSIVLARISQRFTAFHVLAGSYVCGTIFGGSIGVLVGSQIGLPLLLFLAGATTAGSQSVALAATAASYPTTIRSTGIGWAYAAGRCASMISPLIGGALLTADFGTTELFVCLAVPPLLIAAVGIYFAGRELQGKGLNPQALDAERSAV